MKKIVSLLIWATMALACSAAEPIFTVDARHPAGKVSPRLYGLMTEEINHSYDGGLYAELIRNRAFLDDSEAPAHWSAITGNGAEASIALDTASPFNDKLTASLRLTVTQAGAKELAGVANPGYWGIPIWSNTAYHATIIARAAPGFKGPLTLSLASEDGSKVYTSRTISGLKPEWKKFDVTLRTWAVNTPTSKARFQITMEKPGTVWLGFVSLFPPTWNGRPNGLRKDLMEMLVDLNPKFLRFPGGNYLEGNTIESRFDWKKTIGPLEERHGHPCPWGYRSTDGLGLLEFLEWCEDMKSEPVLAVYAGYSLKGERVKPGPELEPFVKEALEEIEYVTGNTKTMWGARRAKDGHSEPFKLNYVEIGNEDWFDKSGSHDERYAQFYDAIKARYPHLKVIASVGNDQPEKRVKSRKPDMADEHYYLSTDDFLTKSPDYARKYTRNGPEIFVGEWAAHEDPKIKPWDRAAREQAPTPALKAAIGDAAFMAAMERNSDQIKMQCYAPLLVNVNPGARQWRPNLIGYDAMNSYGSPSYYAFQMFSRNGGDEILAGTPTGTLVQGCATRDKQTGDLFLKLVNPQPTEEKLLIRIKGVSTMESTGTAITLAGAPEDTNSITEPMKVVPVKSKLHDVKLYFVYLMPSNSIVVLKLKPNY